MAVHGRVAALRPGARVRVRGFRGPEVLGTAVLARVEDGGDEAVLVPTREYGRQWFTTAEHNHLYAVVEELG